MGGSTPSLVPRVAGLSQYMGAPLSEEEILSEFRRYWWDVALSGGCATQIVKSWGLGDHILWGSDFPGASWSDDMRGWLTKIHGL
jgi:6-methylsalicylate decarboxylase